MGEFRGKKELWSVWGIKGGFQEEVVIQAA